MSFEMPAAGPHPGWHRDPAHRHLVHFYETEAFLIDKLVQFVGTTLSNQEAAIVVGTNDHIRGMTARLARLGFDIPLLKRSGQFTTVDAGTVMTRFMVDGMPDRDRFMEIIGGVLRVTIQDWSRVRVFGEMVALITGEDYHTATIYLEALWNELLDDHDFSLCCAYPLGTFTQHGSERLLSDICNQHSTVLPAESYLNLATEDERFRSVALLQQKASQLEIEVANRARVEEQLRITLDSERAAREEAESALRLRDEFVSIAAHELKTPLTSLMGRLQLLLRSLESDRDFERASLTGAVVPIMQQATKLSRLINQLLDVSRLKGGNLALEREPADVVKLVHDCIESINTNASHPAIAVDAPESLVAEVDPLRLEQVIINLLNNAIRYGSEGESIQVSIDWPDIETLEIAVSDGGPGIPVEKRKHIFERFYQAHQEQHRSGMGLGLYICREIVHLHGGTIHAEFPDEGGTRFVVSLPGSTQPAVTSA